MKKKNPELSMKPETMWAIYGTHGFYTGTWLSRFDAIYAHCKALGKGWPQCKANGDRAVKVEICDANERELLDCLEFAHGAIRDAIGLEDGLDAEAGKRVIVMIEDIFKKYGVTFTPFHVASESQSC